MAKKNTQDEQTEQPTPQVDPSASTPTETQPAQPTQPVDQPAAAATKPKQITEAEEPTPVVMVAVRVRPGSRWPTIRSAGMTWSSDPVILRADDPVLVELRQNEYLEVKEVQA